MIRFLLRALGFVLVAAAFAALVVDGTRSIAGGRLLLSSLGEMPAWLGGAREASTVAWLARLPAEGQRAAAALLAVPVWAAAGGLGLLLLHAGRPRTTRIGFSGRRT